MTRKSDQVFASVSTQKRTRKKVRNRRSSLRGVNGGGGNGKGREGMKVKIGFNERITFVVCVRKEGRERLAK